MVHAEFFCNVATIGEWHIVLDDDEIVQLSELLFCLRRWSLGSRICIDHAAYPRCLVKLFRGSFAAVTEERTRYKNYEPLKFLLSFFLLLYDVILQYLYHFTIERAVIFASHLT